jgi:hypothetical protein
VSVVVRRSGPIARFWEKLNAGAPGESRATRRMLGYRPGLAPVQKVEDSSW